MRSDMYKASYVLDSDLQSWILRLKDELVCLQPFVYRTSGEDEFVYSWVVVTRSR